MGKAKIGLHSTYLKETLSFVTINEKENDRFCDRL